MTNIESKPEFAPFQGNNPVTQEDFDQGWNSLIARIEIPDDSLHKVVETYSRMWNEIKILRSVLDKQTY